MNASELLASVQCGAKRSSMGLILAAAVMFPGHEATALPASVELGSAADFAVLAGSGITLTSPTTITGDIGTYPTLTMVGLGYLTLNGTNHAGDAVTQAAKGDLTLAYADAAGRAPTTVYGAQDLGGLTLTSGVYQGSSSFGITGTLTLDGGGDPNAVWIFQAGSTLITASGSAISLIGGAQAGNVFWQVGTSATLGTGTDFAGNILALDSITLNTGATVDGRVLARNAAVALDDNTIVIPEARSLLLLGLGVAVLFAYRRGFVFRN